MESQLEELVKQAIAGDQQALEEVIMSVQDLVYNLSLKMLLFPEDAQDATQEILIKIITHLSTYQGKSQFKTWVYRVATNYLITIKGRKSRQFAMSFEDYEQFVDQGQSDSIRYTQNEGEQFILEEEVKVSCTQGLLLCLSPMARVIYILGDILELNSQAGGEILAISPANFRKQLSRSRTKIRSFLMKKCSLANPQNPCKCSKKIDYLAKLELISLNHIRFAHQTQRSIDLIRQISDLEKTTAIYQSNASFPCPPELKEKINHLLNSF